MFRLNEIIARIPSVLAAARATLLGGSKQPASAPSAPAVPLSIVSKPDPRPTNPWDDAEEWE
jgi:hypothetical protein